MKSPEIDKNSVCKNIKFEFLTGKAEKFALFKKYVFRDFLDYLCK